MDMVSGIFTVRSWRVHEPDLLKLSIDTAQIDDGKRAVRWAIGGLAD